jgi:hypothetical protein
VSSGLYVTLAQLVEKIVFYMLGPEFETWTPHLSILKVEFLANKSYDKKGSNSEFSYFYTLKNFDSLFVP